MPNTTEILNALYFREQCVRWSYQSRDREAPWVHLLSQPADPPGVEEDACRSNCWHPVQVSQCVQLPLLELMLRVTIYFSDQTRLTTYTTSKWKITRNCSTESWDKGHGTLRKRSTQASFQPWLYCPSLVYPCLHDRKSQAHRLRPHNFSRVL